MIDRHLILEKFDETCRRLARKGVAREEVAAARDLLLRRRTLTQKTDDLRAEMNARSSAIGNLYKEGRKAEADESKTEVGRIKEQLSELEGERKEVEAGLEDSLLRLPNFPDERAPDGTSEESNVVLRYENYRAEDYEGKEYLPHWEVAENLGIYDPKRAAKLSGAMFALLRQEGARLIRGLASFALDLNRETYEEVLPPHFVRSDVFTGTGHLPKFEEDSYRLRDDDLWAIPTGEVPLTSLHRGEMLDIAALPKRYMAYTVCFRREAGSAGKDTRGLQRLHEFHKVELVRLCAPEQVETEFASLLADAERPLQILGIPYRVVDLCAGDLTFSSSRIYDIEAYAPGVDAWLEVSSVGIFTDFQARRGNSRFRRSAAEKPEFLHALNGSGLATPRVWAALIEHGQQEDGSVRLPEALEPYLGFSVITSRK